MKQIAGNNIKLDVKELGKDLAKEMNIPFYFNEENLKIGLNINLKGQKII